MSQNSSSENNEEKKIKKIIIQDLELDPQKEIEAEEQSCKIVKMFKSSTSKKKKLRINSINSAKILSKYLEQQKIIQEALLA